MSYIEMLGYLSTALVAGSFLMKDVLKLRLVNTTGALGFMLYSSIKGDVPVLLLNIFVAAVNGYYIWQTLRENKTV